MTHAHRERDRERVKKKGEYSNYAWINPAPICLSLPLFLSLSLPPAPLDSSPYRCERAAGLRAAPPIRSVERDHVNKSRCLNSRSAASSSEWAAALKATHTVGSNNGRLNGNGVQVNCLHFFFLPPLPFSAALLGWCAVQTRGLWDRMCWIKFAVACGWFLFALSPPIRGQDKQHHRLVALHRLRIETQPPCSSLPPPLPLAGTRGYW